MVTDDYRGYRKGVYVRFRKTADFPLPEWEQGGNQMPPHPFMVYSAAPAL